MSTIKLILECKCIPKISVEISNNVIPCLISRDEYDNIAVELEIELSPLTRIKLIVDLEKNMPITLKEIIADNIRFGLVTFLCTTIDDTQHTQLNKSGIIDITIGAPVWKFWCDKTFEFNYKDYPLGSLT
jgi:hypothetical protein